MSTNLTRRRLFATAAAFAVAPGFVRAATPVAAAPGFGLTLKHIESIFDPMASARIQPMEDGSYHMIVSLGFWESLNA